MTGEFTVSSDKYAVRDRLRPLLVLICETLELCIPIVLDNISRQGLPYSPFLFSTNVRCHVKKALKAGGYNAEDPDDKLPLVVNDISNDGIDLDAGSLHVKMFKGEDLPKPSPIQGKTSTINRAASRSLKTNILKPLFGTSLSFGITQRTN